MTHINSVKESVSPETPLKPSQAVPKARLRYLLLLIAVGVTVFSSCITTQPLEQFIQYESKPTVVRDTFNFVYRPARFDSTVKPKAVYTFTYWEPQFYEFDAPSIQTVELKSYKNSYWVARVLVPDNARIVSYKLINVPPGDTGKYRHYHVLLNDQPISESNYRLALAKLYGGEPIDTALAYLGREMRLHPKNFFTYTAYWYYFHKKYNGSDSIKAVISEDITKGFKVFFNDYGYLQSIALTYAYILNDKAKAYDVMKQLYDNFLHPYNLQTRFDHEFQNDRKESILRVLSDKYPNLPMTVELHFKHLYDYMTDKNPDSLTFSRTSLGKIFAEVAANRRIQNLKQSRFNTIAIRYWFRRFAEAGYARVPPLFLREVLQPNYDREVFDVITLIRISQFLAGGQEFAGFAVDLCDRAITLLQEPQFLKYNSGAEHETIDQPELTELIRTTLKADALLNMGKAYLRLGDVFNAKNRLEEAEKLGSVRDPEIAKELAYLYNREPKRVDEGLQSMVRAYVQDPLPSTLKWIEDTSRSKLRNVKLRDRIKQAQNRYLQTCPTLQFNSEDGEVTIDTKSNDIQVLYIWSPKSRLSQSFLADFQVQYAKFRARGVGFYALYPENEIASLDRYFERQRQQYAFIFSPIPTEQLSQLQVGFLPSAVIVRNGKIIYRIDGYKKGFIQRIENAITHFLSEGITKS